MTQGNLVYVLVNDGRTTRDRFPGITQDEISKLRTSGIIENRGAIEHFFEHLPDWKWKDEYVTSILGSYLPDRGIFNMVMPAWSEGIEKLAELAEYYVHHHSAPRVVITTSEQFSHVKNVFEDLGCRVETIS